MKIRIRMETEQDLHLIHAWDSPHTLPGVGTPGQFKAFVQPQTQQQEPKNPGIKERDGQP